MSYQCTHRNRPGHLLTPDRDQESKLKLRVETCRSGDVLLVHCEGRIVYREEAAALSRVVTEALRHCKEIILDLAGVPTIDSAGLGALVHLHRSADRSGNSLKLACPSPHLCELFDLTRLSSLFEIHPTLDDALEGND